MITRIFYVVVILLISQVPVVGDDFCIEPRNSYAEDNVVDIQWSHSDTILYISTLGQVTVYDLNGDASPTVIHKVCEGRFPEIVVAKSYYAIGSDFFSILSVYDNATNSLVHQLDVHSENIRSIALHDLDEYVAVSKSNYDADGFFDIDRKIDVWDINNGEALAELNVGENNGSLYLPFDTDVYFASTDIVVAMGIDREDVIVSPQPIVIIWNWRTNESNSISIEANTLIEPIDSTNLVVLNSVGDQEISLQTMTLLPDLKEEPPHVYNIEIEDLTMARFSANANESLLAIENREGRIWIIDLAAKKIVFDREFERFANHISFDHSGQHLALGYHNGSIEVWDLHSDTINLIGNIFSS